MLAVVFEVRSRGAHCTSLIFGHARPAMVYVFRRDAAVLAGLNASTPQQSLWQWRSSSGSGVPVCTQWLLHDHQGRACIWHRPSPKVKPSCYTAMAVGTSSVHEAVPDMKGMAAWMVRFSRGGMDCTPPREERKRPNWCTGHGRAVCTLQLGLRRKSMPE